MAKPAKPVKPESCKEEHMVYLDDLRESGSTNMFGASVWLEDAFGMDKKDAKEILTYWMKTFTQRHQK